MAEATNMWSYVQNFEMGPVIPPTDALFAQRAGMTRETALEQQPLGGEWVDTWLAALQEAVTHHSSAYYNALTGVMLGMPSDHERRDDAVLDTWEKAKEWVFSYHDQIRTAVANWQFVHARTLAQDLWHNMGVMYQMTTSASEAPDVGEGWQDLRPLLN